MKAKGWLVGLALVSQWAVADETEQYSYGAELDIAKVIAISAPQGCAVGEASMTYLDSQGETHTLTYRRQGEDCHDF